MCLYRNKQTKDKRILMIKQNQLCHMEKLYFITFTLIITTFNIFFQNQFIITSCHPYLNNHQRPMENRYNNIQ